MIGFFPFFGVSLRVLRDYNRRMYRTREKSGTDGSEFYHVDGRDDDGRLQIGRPRISILEQFSQSSSPSPPSPPSPLPPLTVDLHVPDRHIAKDVFFLDPQSDDDARDRYAPPAAPAPPPPPADATAVPYTRPPPLP